ncbi:MAG: FAD-dependent oxidoreductase, partial [Dehalococcoidia bacterium]|nr:FAD-dependent oxidoreductase [Dehalococcoidia bacterium]
RTLIWAGGVRTSEVLERWGLPTGPAGRVKVNDFLEAEGHPGVYVVGDSALVIDRTTQRPAAPSAQLAVAQGEVVARNIFARIMGTEPEAYRPHTTGEAISLGARDGVAWIGPLRLSGAPAQWLKAFIAKRYLWEVGGLKLVQTYTALGKDTVGWDFPQCLVEFRPEAVRSYTEARG